MVEELTEDKEIAYAVMLVSETAFVGAPVCTTLSFSPVGLGCPSIDSKKAASSIDLGMVSSSGWGRRTKSELGTVLFYSGPV